MWPCGAAGPVPVDNNNMCHICAKRFLDSNFNEAVIDKISIFHEIAPNYAQKIRDFKSMDQLILPFQFYGRDM